MKPEAFDWETFPHQHYQGEYSIDFSNNYHRPYKEHDGARLYKDGPLVVSYVPYRQPDQARDLYRKLGLTFRLTKECTDLQFFTYDWTPIRKGSIEGPDMFLLDYTHNVAIFPRHDHPITYYALDAWPSGGVEFKVRVPDKERAKRLKWALNDAIRLGHTYHTMDGPRDEDGLSIDVFIDGFLDGELSLEDLTPEKNSLALWQLGNLVTNSTLNVAINRWSERPLEVTQIRFKVR